jgi:FkbM family methyltransferase
MFRARIIHAVGRIPLAGAALRWLAGRYAEGSVVTIKRGEAAGFRWRRHHRYVNGYWLGHYELPIQRALKRDLRPGDTFFDIGANAGFFSLVAARIVGERGKVVAFDPEPSNYQSLREQFALNDLRNCHPVAEAIGSAEGETVFSMDAPGSSMGRLGAARKGQREIRVRVTTLDAACRQWGIPAMIKVDVEGAEADVLRGAQQLLASGKVVWLIELHGPEPADAVGRMLADAGYRLFDLEDRVVVPGPDLPHHIIARHGATMKP